MDPRLRKMLMILIAEYNHTALDAAQKCQQALKEMDGKDLSSAPELQAILEQMKTMADGLAKGQKIAAEAIEYLKEEEE